MHLSDLPDHLRPGTPLVLHCQTSDKDIYYHGEATNGRTPVRPSPYQLMRIHYTIRGVFSHYDTNEPRTACMVLTCSETGRQLRVYVGGIVRISGAPAPAPVALLGNLNLN